MAIKIGSLLNSISYETGGVVESEESQEQIIESIWKRFKGSKSYPDYHHGIERVHESNLGRQFEVEI